MKKIKSLKPNSKIAIISPSNGLPFLFPDIYELGIKNLREIFNFEVIEMPHARMAPEELYKNPQLRAEDINQAFEDETIDGIIISIGGYESVRILQYLDIDMILNHPKLIMGFSDATTFLSYLNYKGMTTLYGPSIMAGFAQLQHLSQQYTDHIKEMFFGRQYPYIYNTYSQWTNGYQDWRNIGTLGQCTEFFSNKEGYIFLQGAQSKEGLLWGGCIEVLEFLKGTKYWPDENFWKDRILFFETSEDKPLPHQVGYMLRNYGTQGILNKVRGILFGRPKDYSDKEKIELNSIVLEIVANEFGARDIPIVMNMDFGHTDPKIILPLGGKVRIDVERQQISLMDSPFRDK